MRKGIAATLLAWQFLVLPHEGPPSVVGPFRTEQACDAYRTAVLGSWLVTHAYPCWDSTAKTWSLGIPGPGEFGGPPTVPPPGR